MFQLCALKRAPRAVCRSARPLLRAVVLSQHYSTVHDRYAAKLAEKANQKGVSVEELLAESKDDVEKVKKADVADLIKQAEAFKKHKPKSAEPTTSAESEVAKKLAKASKADPNNMGLDSYIDVGKLKHHSKKEIEMLWKARFVGKNNEICGAMEAEVFSRLYIAARKMPTFVLPLPHKTHGIELHYVQWSFVASHTIHCLFTSLAEYKLHNEYAHPHTTFMMHTDLAADKGVVLTNTIVQNNEVPLDSAVFLTLTLQRFYTADPSTKQGAEKLLLLRQFNTGDTNFSAERLIEATETID